MDFKEMAQEMEDFKNLRGAMTIKLVDGNCKVCVNASTHEFAIMISHAIAAFYETLVKSAKEDLENPKEEMKKSIHGLVDVTIEAYEDKCYLESLAKQMEEATSNADAIEILAKAARFIADKGDLE